MYFWQPPNRVRCKISGWTLGVNATATGTRDSVMRVYRTFIDENGGSTIKYEGGGVNAIIFSLQFLWEEYRLFHNWWSETNDGHDLARYFKTKIYLPPHRFCDYIFWWDRDWQKYTNEHFLRCHPVNLFNWKQKVFVRSQNWGRNVRTKKVTIRPPATTTNLWRHMKDWYYTPLFAWGITIIDWYKFFSRGKMMPYTIIPNACVSNYVQAEGNLIWTQEPGGLYYNAWYDTGENNRLFIQVTTKDGGLKNVPMTTVAWRPVTWANDLPYWMTFFGQNKTWDFGVIKYSEFVKPSGQDLNDRGELTIWFRICYPIYKSVQEANNSSTTLKWIAWKQQVGLNIYNETTLPASYGMAYCGPFVPAEYSEQIEIPILYSSYWQWGGQTWSNMEVINPGHFMKSAVTVKNPYTVARSVIHPWDTDSKGLLTNEALARFIQPSSTVEERRPQPWAGLREEDPYKPDYSETGSEAEESETEQDEESECEENVRTLARRLQREQLKRRRLFAFLRSLLKSKSIQEREGAEPLPPPNGGPPYPQTCKWE